MQQKVVVFGSQFDNGCSQLLQYQSNACCVLGFRGCLFLPNASGWPRSAEVGGNAAKNSISYMKIEAAYLYQPYAKAGEICREP